MDHVSLFLPFNYKTQLMLRKASHTLYVNGKMTHEEMHNYHMAVTEREVINGCLSITKDVKDHIIIYTRIINNINLQNLKRASAFIDINDRKVDQEAVKLLAHYRYYAEYSFLLNRRHVVIVDTLNFSWS